MKGRGVIKVAYWGYFLGITEVAWNLHQILRHICNGILIRKQERYEISSMSAATKEREISKYFQRNCRYFEYLKF